MEEVEDFLRFVFDEDIETLTPFFFLARCAVVPQDPMMVD